MTDGSEQGWVEALPPEDETGMMPQVVAPRPEPRGRIVAGLVLTVVIVAAIGLVAAWRASAGDPMASARMVPSDVDLAVTVDVLQLGDGERLERLIGAFADPLHEAGVISEPFDLVDTIDQALQEQTDLTLSGDVLSWIGRSATVAVAMGDMNWFQGFGEFDGIDQLGGDTGFAENTVAPAAVRTADAAFLQSGFSPGVLITAAVRDHAAAAAFVDKMVALAESADITVTARTVAGYEGFELTEEFVPESELLVLTDDMLLFGTDAMVTRALALDGGTGSLADDADYQAALRRLPEDRMITAFIDTGFLGAMAGGSFGTSGLPGGELGSYAMSLSVVDEGVRLNYGYVGSMEQAGEGPDMAILESLPSDVIAFFSATGGTGVGDMAQLDPSVQFELDQIAAEIESITGIRFLDLLGALSGDVTVAVTETRDGSIARESAVPIGLVGAVGLLDRQPIDELLGILRDHPDGYGLELVDDGDLTTVRFGGRDVASLSLGDDLLVVGTGPELVGAVADGTGEGVTGTALYRELDDLVAGDGLSIFVDVSRLAGLIPLASEERAVIGQARGIGGGIAVDGDGFNVELLILIDY